MNSLFILNNFSKYEFTCCPKFIFSKDEFFFYLKFFHIELVFSKDQLLLEIEKYYNFRTFFMLQYFKNTLLCIKPLSCPKLHKGMWWVKFHIFSYSFIRNEILISGLVNKNRAFINVSRLVNKTPTLILSEFFPQKKFIARNGFFLPKRNPYLQLPCEVTFSLLWLINFNKKSMFKAYKFVNS